MAQNILMILDNGFNPDQRVHKEARYLIGCGHRVTILCWDRDGRFRNKLQEQVEGISIQRIEIPSQYGSGLRQMLPLFQFAVSCRKTIKEMGSFDKYHCYDLNGILAGWIATWGFFKKPHLIFDMKEFYESGNLRKICVLVHFLVLWMQRKSEWIIYLNEKQKKGVAKADQHKLVFLPNYPERKKFCNANKIKSNRLRISYIGFVRHIPQLKALISAASGFEQIEVYIHGDGVGYEEIKSFASVYPRAHVTGAFAHENILGMYQNTDLLYCVYDCKDENDRTAYPTKFYEAIAMQTPLIVSKGTLVGDFCFQHGIGFCAETDLDKSLVDLFEKALSNPQQLEEMAKRMQQLSKDFIWETVVPNLNLIYPVGEC